MRELPLGIYSEILCFFVNLSKNCNEKAQARGKGHSKFVASVTQLISGTEGFRYLLWHSLYHWRWEHSASHREGGTRLPYWGLAPRSASWWGWQVQILYGRQTGSTAPGDRVHWPPPATGTGVFPSTTSSNVLYSTSRHIDQDKLVSFGRHNLKIFCVLIPLIHTRSTIPKAHQGSHCTKNGSQPQEGWRQRAWQSFNYTWVQEVHNVYHLSVIWSTRLGFTKNNVQNLDVAVIFGMSQNLWAVRFWN